MDLKEQLEALEREYADKLAAASTEQEMRKVYADYGGGQGAIRRMHKEALKAAPPTEKKNIGQLGNALFQRVDGAFEGRLAQMAQAARQKELARSIDLTLPGRPHRPGTAHPLTLVRREAERIFAQLGFVVAEGPH